MIARFEPHDVRVGPVKEARCRLLVERQNVGDFRVFRRVRLTDTLCRPRGKSSPVPVVRSERGFFFSQPMEYLIAVICAADAVCLGHVAFV